MRLDKKTFWWPCLFAWCQLHDGGHMILMIYWNSEYFDDINKSGVRANKKLIFNLFIFLVYLNWGLNLFFSKDTIILHIKLSDNRLKN